jgi:hypothetical protein
MGTGFAKDGKVLCLWYIMPLTPDRHDGRYSSGLFSGLGNGVICLDFPAYVNESMRAYGQENAGLMRNEIKLKRFESIPYQPLKHYLSPVTFSHGHALTKERSRDGVIEVIGSITQICPFFLLVFFSVACLLSLY